MPTAEGKVTLGASDRLRMRVGELWIYVFHTHIDAVNGVECTLALFA